LHRLKLHTQVQPALAAQAGSRNASTSAAAGEQAAPWARWAAGALGAAAGLAAMTTAAAADHEGEHGLDAGSWPWSHSGLLDSYDHASIRRGYQVYKQVRLARGEPFNLASRIF
jgi:ubiquinol-cytochrome c reductase cytochrome c1 subunit